MSSNAARSARRLSLFTVLAVAAPAIFSSSAEATWQPNSECAGSEAGFVPIWSGSVAAQTFPAEHSGKLLKVMIKNVARASGGTGGDISVQLYGTEAGTPVAPAMASTAILDANVIADDFYHDYTVEFEPSSAAYLTAGQSYAIAISTADSVQNVWGFGENLCPGVALFGGGPPFGPPLGHTNWDAGLVTYLAPANDDFEHAQLLSGQDTAEEGTTAGATRQPGEPDHYTSNPPDSNLWVGDHTVWFRWRAPNSGPTTIDTCLGSIDSILAVYEGSQLNALTKVADNNNDPACSGQDPYGSKVSFEAVGGSEYRIAVGDAGGAREGPFAVTIHGAPDTTPPQTKIDSGPSGSTAATAAAPPPSDRSRTLPDSLIRKAKVNSAAGTARFKFTSTATGVGFLCKLDRAPFRPCTSPKTYRHLKVGGHVFEVRAVDAAGDSDPTPAIRRFKIES